MRQLQKIRGEILSLIGKDYSHDDVLPPYRSLAAQFHTSINTIYRALCSLQEAGYVQISRSKGTVVIKKPFESSDPHSAGFILHNAPHAEDTATLSLITGMESVFQKNNIDLSLNFSYRVRESEIRLIDSLYAKNIRNIIVYPSNDPLDEKYLNFLTEKKKSGMNIVLIDKYFSGNHFSCAVMDGLWGIFGVCSALYQTGEKYFVYTVMPDPPVSIIERELGFDLFISRTKAESEKITFPSRFFDNPLTCTDLPEYARLAELIKKKHTVIVCPHDGVAAAAGKYLMSRNFSIPEDVRITGFGNLPLLKDLPFPVSTCGVDFHLLGLSAAELLVRHIHEPGAPAQRIVVQSPVMLNFKKHTGEPHVR